MCALPLCCKLSRLHRDRLLQGCSAGSLHSSVPLTHLPTTYYLLPLSSSAARRPFRQIAYTLLISPSLLPVCLWLLPFSLSPSHLPSFPPHLSACDWGVPSSAFRLRDCFFPPPTRVPPPSQLTPGRHPPCTQSTTYTPNTNIARPFAQEPALLISPCPLTPDLGRRRRRRNKQNLVLLYMREARHPSVRWSHED